MGKVTWSLKEESGIPGRFVVVSRPFGVSVPLVLSFSPIFLSVWDANELIFPTKVANTLTFSQRYGVAIALFFGCNN